MNSTLQKLLATILVVIIIGGGYYLVNKNRDNNRVLPRPSNQTIQADKTTTENQAESLAADKYLYTDDFYYTADETGLTLYSHSDQNFAELLTTNQVENVALENGILQFSEIIDGRAETKFFNLESLVQRLNEGG